MRTSFLAALLFATPQLSAEAQESTVPTFHGLRQLEQDPKVSDADKAEAWEAFVRRAEKEVAYARAAAAQWRAAGRLRLVAAARAMEEDPAYGAQQRAEMWTRVLEQFPEGPEAGVARDRVKHWRTAELDERVRAAEALESGQRPKVERVLGWAAVLDWAPEAKAGRQAKARMAALRGQLLTEARTADGIERLDAATKLELWKDVLRARPTDAEAAEAKRRIQALQGG